MLRFAPSQTGDMHVGNLRIAIFNYLLSKKNDEALIVRIENIDKEKNIESKDEEILDILGLFGIEYTEVIHQSNHLKYHRTMALQLLHDKKAFNCFCTQETLNAKREAAKAAKKEYRYDGTCENLPADMTIDNMNPFVIRLKDSDSFVIMNKEKYPTHNFACAVDDMISDISMVILEDKYTNDTLKQIAVRKALGYDKEINYIYLASLTNEEDFTIKWLLEEGFLPEAIANYLILTAYKTPKEIFTLKEAIEWFELSNISKEPLDFDIDKLRFINKEHLKMLDSKELSRYVGFADGDIGEIAKIYLETVSTLKELRSKIEPIFADKKIPQTFMQETDIMKKAIQNAPHFEEFNEFKSYIMSKTALKEETFSKVLSLLLTGVEDGVKVSSLYPFLKNYLGEIVK